MQIIPGGSPSRHRDRERRLWRNGRLEPDQKGINVLLLDAGDKFDRSKYWTHVQPWEARDRTARGEQPPQFYLDTKEQPYLTPAGARRADAGLGTWRQDERVGPREPALFGNGPEGGERDGWEIPWPIAYTELSPYYDQVEQLIGVNGGTTTRRCCPAASSYSRRRRPAAGSACCRRHAKVGIPVVAGGRARHDEPHSRDPAVSLLRRLRRRV